MSKEHTDALSDAEVKKYLARIGYDGPREATKTVLDELAYRHQCTVPFETLDSHDFHIIADLGTDALFDKIVLRHRGGYCLELNGLFFRLLKAFSFDVRPCLCRVLLGTDEFTHPIDHRANLVRLDGREYFCDVGLGGPMPPGGLDISLQDWQTLRGEQFLIKKDVPGWYALIRKTRGGSDIYGAPDANVRTELLFSAIQCYETDVAFLNYYMSVHPEALHVKRRILNLRTREGYRAILDAVYREARNGIVVEQEIGDRLMQILKEKFGICLPDANKHRNGE